MCASHPITARQWRHHKWQDIAEVVSLEDLLHVEYPGGQCSLWAWPHDLLSLALGHVLLDRVHEGPDDAPGPCRQASAEALPAPEGQHRVRVTLGAACETRPSDGTTVTARHVLACMDAVMGLPGMWSGTGCFHRAAMVYLPTGRVEIMSEDIGRHNCLDRLMGQAIRRGLSPGAYALFLSARITASLYCKARRAGFTCLVSRAAVTSAAFERAVAQGVTLVGFCRASEERLTVFTDPSGRIRS